MGNDLPPSPPLPFGDPASTQVDSRSPRPRISEAESLLANFLDPPRRERDAGTFQGWPILGLIGTGGMAVVLHGYDERLKRDVAIKVIRPEFAGQRQAVSRFAREARMAAQVRHDNAVVVYAVEDQPPAPYLIMEYLQGGTLKNRLRRGRLPEAECIELTLQIAAGLEAAHALGLLHRDIKPSNIGFRRAHGPAVLMDFGLARTLSDTDPITEHGSLVGTPSYMSPEQVQMHPLDVRSDLFSVGAMLYQMATGCLPFPGESPVTICHAVVHAAQKPACEVCPKVSKGLSAVIDRLLEKDPQRRFSSTRDLVQALQTLSQSTPPPPRRHGNAVVVGTAAAAVISLLAGALWLAFTPPRSGEVSPRPAEAQPQAAETPVARTPRTDPWRLHPARRPGLLQVAATGGWTLGNDKPDYDWVMAEAELPYRHRQDRYLLFTIREVASEPASGWAVKLADPQGGFFDTELVEGAESGEFAVLLPSLDGFNSRQESCTVRFFTRGPQGASVQFADIQFADSLPDSRVLLPSQR
jgi:serine/threonine protein kinase